MISPVKGRDRMVVVAFAVLVIVPITAGCLTEDEPVDTYGWYVSMNVDQFNNNGQIAMNNTGLLFDVRFGDLHKENWRVEESGGFFKEEDDTYPIRIEASYTDGINPPEDFPILGSSNVITGALRVKNAELQLALDGDQSKITIEDFEDIYPNWITKSTLVVGDHGELRLLFRLAEPIE